MLTDLLLPAVEGGFCNAVFMAPLVYRQTALLFEDILSWREGEVQDVVSMGGYASGTEGSPSIPDSLSRVRFRWAVTK